MPCYKPLLAYHGPGGITFNAQKSFGIKIELPCGRCIGCRIDRTQAWALRITHEAQMHQETCFLTLTYDDDHLPPDGSLQKIDFQKFIRALRNKTKLKIRYYMCGEYGDETKRPHYHAILFGYDFPDRTHWRTEQKKRMYRSATLERIWHHGISEIGDVNFKSAAYCARYIMKKLNGERAEAHYQGRQPEYTNMSTNPGIGFSWYKKYKTDIFPCDQCVDPNGKIMPVPKYYRVLLEREDPKLHQELRDARVERARINPDNTPERLAVREFCKSKKIERLKRPYL